MTNWQNRIIGYGEEAPDQLLANPRNARIHPKHQQDALAGVLREVGIVQDVIVNQRTGMLVDGHLRVSLALRDDQPVIPVKYVDLSEAEEALILATLDPIAAQAAYDREKLDDLLRDVSTGEAGVSALIEKLAAQQGLIEPPSVDELWKGMPEFEHEDRTNEAAFTIRVFLKDADDLAEFGRLIGKDLTGKKFVWFGKQPQGTTYEVFE